MISWLFNWQTVENLSTTIMLKETHGYRQGNACIALRFIALFNYYWHDWIFSLCVIKADNIKYNRKPTVGFSKKRDASHLIFPVSFFNPLKMYHPVLSALIHSMQTSIALFKENCWFLKNVCTCFTLEHEDSAIIWKWVVCTLYSSLFFWGPLKLNESYLPFIDS